MAMQGIATASALPHPHPPPQPQLSLPANDSPDPLPELPSLSAPPYTPHLPEDDALLDKNRIVRRAVCRSVHGHPHWRCSWYHGSEENIILSGEDVGDETLAEIMALWNLERQELRNSGEYDDDDAADEESAKRFTRRLEDAADRVAPNTVSVTGHVTFHEGSPAA